MLELKPPDYKFCPFCGNELKEKELDGRSRKYCSEDNWMYFPHVATAAVAVIQKGNEVLMVQRNRDPYKGTWMFPAGFTEYGEHPSEVAVREVLEETGFRVENPLLIEVIQVDDDPREIGHLAFFYKVELSILEAGEISDKEENQNITWHPLNNLPEIGWNSHKYISELLQEK